MSTIVKNYCKVHKLKLVSLFENGFVAEKKIPVMAGMKYDPSGAGSSNYISIPVREIGKKTIHFTFEILNNNDIIQVAQNRVDKVRPYFNGRY